MSRGGGRLRGKFELEGDVGTGSSASCAGSSATLTPLTISSSFALVSMVCPPCSFPKIKPTILAKPLLSGEPALAVTAGVWP